MLSSLSVAACMPPYVETRIIGEEVEPVDFETGADLIGISFMTYNAPRAYEIADKFRWEKGKPVIVGGYHPTFMPEEAIQHVDSVCIGEAEGNMPRMIADFTAGAFKPFYNSEPVELVGLPRPDPALIREQDYAPVDVLQATRGCHYQCSFCSVSAFHHHCFRVRPIAEVIDELKTLGRNVLFMDDNIIGDREYAKQLFIEMIPLNKRWFSRTLEFLLEANVESLQATRLTLFPGTPLFAELDRNGRIFDKNWAHYDFNNVVLQPLHMRCETLDQGVAWVLRQFHTRSRVARRVWKRLRYLDPLIVLGGVLPLNLGWRRKLLMDGNFQRGALFATDVGKTL
jgi:hypothetical protein